MQIRRKVNVLKKKDWLDQRMSPDLMAFYLSLPDTMLKGVMIGDI